MKEQQYLLCLCRVSLILAQIHLKVVNALSKAPSFGFHNLRFLVSIYDVRLTKNWFDLSVNSL